MPYAYWNSYKLQCLIEIRSCRHGLMQHLAVKLWELLWFCQWTYCIWRYFRVIAGFVLFCSSTLRLFVMHCNYTWIRIQLKMMLHPNRGFYEFWFLAHVHAVTTDCPCSSNGFSHPNMLEVQPANCPMNVWYQTWRNQTRKIQAGCLPAVLLTHEIFLSTTLSWMITWCHITLLAKPGFWSFQGSATKKC